jgi:hypothetical protein
MSMSTFRTTSTHAQTAVQRQVHARGFQTGVRVNTPSPAHGNRLPTDKSAEEPCAEHSDQPPPTACMSWGERGREYAPRAALAGVCLHTESRGFGKLGCLKAAPLVDISLDIPVAFATSARRSFAALRRPATRAHRLLQTPAPGDRHPGPGLACPTLPCLVLPCPALPPLRTPPALRARRSPNYCTSSPSSTVLKS